jgi:hypothetical protein
MRIAWPRLPLSFRQWFSGGRGPLAAMPRFKVIIDDNFHYMDEDARIAHGTYRSAEKAIAACRRIVDESLRHLHEPGMSAADLMAQYVLFGDDPFIVTEGDAAASSESVRFSARDYARERCQIICG